MGAHLVRYQLKEINKLEEQLKETINKGEKKPGEICELKYKIRKAIREIEPTVQTIRDQMEDDLYMDARRKRNYKPL